MRSEKGFTLIELLVVVAIIGILAAIAIPQFAEYKTRAFNSRAQSDLRNALTAEEAYFVDNEEYASCSDSGCSSTLPGFVLSEDVSISMLRGGSDNDEFAGQSCHTRGDRDYDWRSSGTNANIMQNTSVTSCAAAATF